MPFFPNGCRALLDAWRAAHTLAVSWHTAQPNTNGIKRVRPATARRGSLSARSPRHRTRTAETPRTQARLNRRRRVAAWARVTHLAIVSAMTGGTFHAYAALGSAVTLGNGEKIRIPAGDLDITIPVS